MPAPDHDYLAEILPDPTNNPAGFVLIDPEQLLGDHNNDPDYPPKSATLVVPRIDVTWESRPGNVALDANLNAGGGMRILPDATSPTDIVTGRDRVKVRVKTTPPVPLQNVRLRWLDVDDPAR